MKKIILIATLLLIAKIVEAQQERWSNLEYADKIEALSISNEIIKGLNDKTFSAIVPYLYSNEICLNGGMWSPTEEFTEMIESLINKKIFYDSTLTAYTFDDFQNDPELQAIPRNVFRVFSNRKIIVTGRYNVQHDKADYDFYLIFGNYQNKWLMSAIYLSDVKLIDKTSANSLANHRKETIDSLGLTLMVPEDFSGLVLQDSYPSFILKGETPRDAIIQIISTDLRAPYDFMTKKYVELVVLKIYPNSNYTIKYLSNGIMFDYFVVNPDDNMASKGITIGVENNGKLIIIQYYSFEETHSRIWRDIDLMIRTIEI